MSTQTQQEYRTLEPHETIESGDEFRSVGHEWAPVHTSIGHTPAFMKQEYRRPIKPEPTTSHRHCHQCQGRLGLGYHADSDGHEFCGERCVESYRKSPASEIERLKAEIEAWKRECGTWKEVWTSPEAVHANLLRSPLYPEMRMKFLHLAGAADYDTLKASREKLQAFKDYVHDRLTMAGVPGDPESAHRAEGCRIGGRLDWIMAERDRLAAENAKLRGHLKGVTDRVEWAIQFLTEKPFKPWDSADEWADWAKEQAAGARAALAQPEDATPETQSKLEATEAENAKLRAALNGSMEGEEDASADMADMAFKAAHQLST